MQLYKQHIYKTPRFASSLLRWSEELGHAGFDVPYRGENIAGYTQQVIIALIKNRKKKVPRAERFKVLEAYNHRCAQMRGFGQRVQQYTGTRPPMSLESWWRQRATIDPPALKLPFPQILFGMSDPISGESARQRIRRECV